jgi:hypothetical protein
MPKNTIDDAVRRQFQKTRLCTFYSEGACRYGEQGCPFAHGMTEVKGRPDLNKTSLCRNWANGKCSKSAVECSFAHGVKELRQTEAFSNPFQKKDSKGNAKQIAKNRSIKNSAKEPGLQLPLPRKENKRASITRVSSKPSDEDARAIEKDASDTVQSAIGASSPLANSANSTGFMMSAEHIIDKSTSDSEHSVNSACISPMSCFGPTSPITYSMGLFMTNGESLQRILEAAQPEYYED